MKEPFFFFLFSLTKATNLAGAKTICAYSGNLVSPGSRQTRGRVLLENTRSPRGKKKKKKSILDHFYLHS